MKLDPETGEPVTQLDADEVAAREARAQELASKPQSLNYGDAKEFAAALGIPYANLEILLRDHHERDPLVRQSVHEHVAFVKTSEGYP